MDDTASAQFIASLVKTVQALCNGYVNFSSSVEVVGHIHLNVDRKVKLDYVLTEEVSKSVGEEDATVFSSHSYPSKPPPELITISPEKPADRPESVNSPLSDSSSKKVTPCVQASASSVTASTSRRRKTQHVPRVDDLESFTISTVPRIAALSRTNSSSPASVVRRDRSDSHNSTSLDSAGVYSEDSTFLHQAEKESKISAASASSSFLTQDRHRKASSSHDAVPAKQQRTASSNDTSENLKYVELIQIKEEPDDSSYHFQSASEAASDQDMMQASVEGDLASLQGGSAMPYPVMLHGMDTAQHPHSLPSASMPLPAMPSTSTDTMVEQAMEIAHKAVRTYTGKRRGRKPKKKWRKFEDEKMTYCEYTTEDMNEAIELVHAGMSVIDAALKYGIPRATLFNRSREGCKTHTGRCSEVFLRTHVGQESSKKRVKSHYTPETVEKAINDIHNGMPVIDAAILYDIPRATLFIRSSKGCPTHEGRCATVSSNGKLKRTKVSRFRYLNLMHQKTGAVGVDDLSFTPTSGLDAGFTFDPTQFSMNIAPEMLQELSECPDDSDEDGQGTLNEETFESVEPSEQFEQATVSGSSDQDLLFETLSGAVVVKIEKGLDANVDVNE